MKIGLFYGGLLVLSLLLSSCEKQNYYTVRFFSEGELLYTTEVLEGANAYYGNEPTKEPELDGDYIISYTFSGWDKNTYGIYEDTDFNAIFDSLKTFNYSPYENVSNEQGLIDFILKKTKSEAYLNISGNYEYYTEYRYSFPKTDSYTYYMGYIPSESLWKIAFSSSDNVGFTYFKYQEYNSTNLGYVGRMGSNFNKTIRIDTSTHLFVDGDSIINNACSTINEFCAKNGYGILTD